MDPMKYYLRPPTVVGLRYWLVLGAFGVLTGCLAAHAVRTDSAADRAESRVARAVAAQARQVTPVPKAIEPAVLKRWASLQVEREFSWGDVFAAVEKASSDDVELLAFEPDKANRTIQLKGEAHDQKALLAFIDALAQQPNLRNVHLTFQQRHKRDRVDTIMFELKAVISG